MKALLKLWLLIAGSADLLVLVAFLVLFVWANA